MPTMAKRNRDKKTGEAILTKYGVERSELRQARSKGRLSDPELLDALELLEEADTETRSEPTSS